MLRSMLLTAALLVAAGSAMANPKVKPTVCEESYAGELISAKALQAQVDVGVYPMEGQDAAAFLLAFNTEPPVSFFTADALLVVTTGPTAQVEFFKAGCMTAALRVPSTAFDAVAIYVFGQPGI